VRYFTLKAARQGKEKKMLKLPCRHERAAIDQPFSFVSNTSWTAQAMHPGTKERQRECTMGQIRERGEKERQTNLFLDICKLDFRFLWRETNERTAKSSHCSSKTQQTKTNLIERTKQNPMKQVKDNRNILEQRITPSVAWLVDLSISSDQRWI
jgi:hypothetical protein